MLMGLGDGIHAGLDLLLAAFEALGRAGERAAGSGAEAFGRAGGAHPAVQLLPRADLFAALGQAVGHALQVGLHAGEHVGAGLHLAGIAPEGIRIHCDLVHG